MAYTFVCVGLPGKESCSPELIEVYKKEYLQKGEVPI